MGTDKTREEIFWMQGVRSQNLDDTTGLEAAAGPIRALAVNLQSSLNGRTRTDPKAGKGRRKA